ncbi:nucleotide-binding universal stress UspA family protein [Actinoplanes lutulentus]|uniref:universal stress protein n=1 Tax=Actinoplanes lutulentus TaxID=1287878 RepID=UPI00182EBAF7|nr:universal stress protein [Actinoplanes lutulentus]MBB2947520.1 nucleotide-binding universal stress UspA family protein [Actinoplanes lutulentus]
MSPVSAILVGVDGSPSSQRAAAYAVGVALRQRSKLVAVFVRSLPSPLLPLADSGGNAAIIDAQGEIEQELRATLAQLRPELGIEVELLVRTGEPFAELIAVAKELQADAVIVGRSTKMLHRIAGSLAVKLVRYGHWPVTVVP